MASLKFAALRVHQAINAVRPDLAGIRRAIRANDEVARDLAGRGDNASARRRALALWNAGGDLKKIGQFARAAQRLEEAEAIYRRFDSERDAAIHVAVSRAGALIFLNRWEEAVHVLGGAINVVGLGGAFPNASVAHSQRTDVITAAVNLWLRALGQTGRTDWIKEGADAVIVGFDPPITDGQRAAVAEAFLLKGAAARADGDLEAALSALEESAKRCDGETHVLFVVTSANAMVERAKALRDAGRLDEAVATCDDVAVRFRSVTDTSTRAAIREARKLKRTLPGSRLTRSN